MIAQVQNGVRESCVWESAVDNGWCSLTRVNAAPMQGGAYGGEGGIRTLGTGKPVHPISSRVRSTTPAPLPIPHLGIPRFGVYHGAQSMILNYALSRHQHEALRRTLKHGTAAFSRRPESLSHP